jgi:hypothetical protein
MEHLTTKKTYIEKMQIEICPVSIYACFEMAEEKLRPLK